MVIGIKIFIAKLWSQVNKLLNYYVTIIRSIIRSICENYMTKNLQVKILVYQ